MRFRDLPQKNIRHFKRRLKFWLLFYGYYVLCSLYTNSTLLLGICFIILFASFYYSLVLILKRQNYNQTKKFDKGTRKAIKLIIIKYTRAFLIACAFSIVKVTKQIYFAYFSPLDCSGWNNRLVLTQTKMFYMLCLISPHNKFISRWPAS